MVPEAVAAPNAQLLWVSSAVLLASSTWFAGTAAAPAIAAEWQLGAGATAWLTIATQLGFIAGTALYALLNLADVFNARRVFLVSAALGAVANGAFAVVADGLTSAIAFRFITGITLAGVYPVGMKLVASWFRDGLGWRLGVMVGALTVGTSLPYLVAGLGAKLPWRDTSLVASGLALAGGLIAVGLVRDGPFLRERARFDLRVAARVFRRREFRLTALGYFGHMWELYALWALVGSYLIAAADGQAAPRAIALTAFAVVAVGAIGCVGGGWLSRKLGERRVALFALGASALCCILSPAAFTLSSPLLVCFVILWGVFVVADSPQFSALAARHCPPEYTGTALTVQNGIGFALTIAPLQLLPLLADEVSWRWAFVALAPGPILGAIAMLRLGTAAESNSV